MEEVTLLLDGVTKGLPPAERNTERSKPQVRSAIKEYRDPTQKTLDQLMQNVSDQEIWIKNNLKEYSEYDYCYDKYRLVINHEINDYTTIGKGISNLLFVHVSWTASSPCRKSYLERLNPNPPKL